MQKIITERSAIHLIGITTRTNTKAELDPTSAKIAPCVMRYFLKQLFNKIPNRKTAGTTYCAYTEYESDHTGDYTYFIGEEVNSHDTIPEGMQALTIPAQKYAKFTTDHGAMPAVCIDAWQEIWKMSNETLGGKRRYAADFELYDERARDHHNLVLDIYIGIIS